MGRALQADMYENREPRVVAWKEPMYGGGAGSRRRTVSQAEVQRRPGGSRKNVRRRTRRKTQYKILRGILIYFIIAGIAATCFMLFSLLAGGKEKVHAEGLVENGGTVVGNALRGLFSKEEELGDEDADAFGEPDGALYGEEGAAESGLVITPEIRQECQNLYAENASLLILVNKEHELPVSYDARLRSICEGRLQAADILYEDLRAMLKDGKEAGFQYWIASAHRDRSCQQGLVDEDVEKYMAKGYSYEAALKKTYEYTMPAGKSEHETGLALDILCSTNTMMDESQKSEPGNQWLVEHCHEYGFILRYPEDKEGTTGIRYEPWHFRYVGRKAAAYLKEKGWTLEEFYEAAGSDAALFSATIY